MKKKPYKSMYVIECELCHRITPVTLPGMFDPWECKRYRAIDSRGNWIWLRLEDRHPSSDGAWVISDETVICDKCKRTLEIANALQGLDQEDLDALRTEMHNRQMGKRLK